MRRAPAILLAAAALAGAGCGDDDSITPGRDDGGGPAAGGAPAGRTDTVERTTRVEVVRQVGGRGFDPQRIYERVGPGVVTVFSIFEGGAGGILGGDDDDGGQGSGFVLNERGEIATNAHVVSTGEGDSIRKAKEVFVKFADGNQVPARIVGSDPNADVALLRVDAAGLRLRPLELGRLNHVEVGEPVAAIGSPFGEEQSLSIGIVSALGRTIDSLTGFGISGAIQTDAAINRGNSGGPLVDADGRVVGINSQIRSTGGGGEGVGFAVAVNTIRRSLDQLRAKGRVDYAYLGIQSQEVYPQLAERFDLGADRGVWVQIVEPKGPAADAGLKGGGREVRFQAQRYRTGGDVIRRIDGRTIDDANDLSAVLARYEPRQKITLEVFRGGDRREIEVTLGSRPSEVDREP